MVLSLMRENTGSVDSVQVFVCGGVMCVYVYVCVQATHCSSVYRFQINTDDALED